MKSASAGLISLLGTSSFVFADLYTITPVSGSVIRLTTADVDVSSGGNTYVSKAPQLSAGESGARAILKTGLDVDSWQFSIQPRSVDPVSGAVWPDLINGQTWDAAARGGAFDGATLQVDRAYWAAWPTPWRSPLTPEEVLQKEFFGRIADIDIDGPTIVITANSWLELLTQPVPREVYQAGCRHTLFNTGCSLNAASYAASGTLLGGSTQSVLLSSLAAPAGSGTYTQGRVVFTSGANAGFSRTVRQWSAGAFQLLSPLPRPVATSDAFTAYPGCNRTQANCTAFSNLANYGGQPFIPVPETAA